MKLFAVTLALVAVVATGSFAQTNPDDPAIQKAKVETQPAFDLARFFGYLKAMEEKNPKLALSKEQLEEVYATMKRFQAMQRVEPAEAAKTLAYLEDKLLKPEQLIAVDQIAIEREQARTTQTTAGSGDGGLITSYIAGGPFNPMAGATRTIGKDFADYLAIVSRRLGK